MKRISSDKYTIAWFKLSEIISRGEKERALGMYRLLAHSLDNSAFAKQLEGDILLFFNDNAAHEKYREAVQIYLKQERFLEAAMLYEHLLSIGVKPSENYFLDLIEWYGASANTDKIKQYCLAWASDSAQMKKWEDIPAILAKVAHLLKKDTVQTELFLNILEKVISFQAPSQITMSLIHDYLITLIADDDSRSLQQILSYLRSTHTEYYEKACELLHNQ